MPLRYKRSRQLAAEIENTRFKWGVRVVSPTDGDMRVEARKDSKMPKTPIRQTAEKGQQVSKKQSPADCQQKSCYCREGRTPKKTESRSSEKNPETRVTWDQILSKHLNLGARPEQIPTKMNQYCQGEEKPRPVERPRSLGGEKWCRRTLDDWCHPECFVKDLALNQPGDLLDLKTEIDRAVKKMGLKDCCPPEEPTRDFNRPKVVLEYLEELSVEMLKKRLEETESRYKNMRKKLEDALVNNKLEIQSLKNELFIKNEEVTRLLKNQESQVNATTAKRRDSLLKMRKLPGC
uniref:Uncharacterized protein n=2 Tax=Lygus hesperus TaxID=30085 RepID=A0A146LZR3_LYGHE